MSYSLIKLLQLLIDQEHTHPEWGWQHQAPGATLWEVSWCNQVLDHYICMDQIYPFTQAGFCAQKESRKVRSTKPRETKHEEGSKIPLVPMWTSHCCCKERFFSLPLPFLMALRVITWDTNSAHHLLLVPFKALLMKPDPDLSSLLLSSLEFEKGQVYLASELFSKSVTSWAFYFRVWSDSKPQCENVKGPWKICNYISDLEETINEMEFLGPSLCRMICSSLPVSWSLSTLMAQKSFYRFKT